ncbi:hypothetical protein DOZ80_01445 [Pseudomonas fluorescens]|uniref:Bacterial Ig-like domain-containing protein n=2 Tax=Pseudomonas fluorescens TaxID=294 RepID=A0A327NDC4_PSEFL|nr:hypothetical protein DOZ80_01445 [Pseudomonas fluorescens]
MNVYTFGSHSEKGPAMTDQSEIQIEDEVDPRMEVLVPPEILAPAGSLKVVSRGFKVHAVAYSGGHLKWNLDFFRTGSSSRFARYSGGAGFINIEWWAPDTLPVGQSIYFKIQYQSLVGLYSRWARSHDFQIASVTRPSINLPSGGLVREKRPVITGKGERGAIIKLYQTGSTAVEYGRGTVQNSGSWSIPLTTDLPQGDTFSMGAGQTFNSQLIWAQDVRFTVIYPPVLGNVTVSDRTPTINGSGGLANATVEVFFVGASGGVQATAQVRANGTWTAVAPRNWSTGTHSITARQIAPNSRHHSGWAVEKAVDIPPPVPVITLPGSPLERGDAIRGTGFYSGATLVVRKSGTVVGGRVTTSGSTWSFIADQMWPGDWTITAEQTLNGQNSGRSTPRSFKVRPPKLKITDPAPGSPVPSSQKISGNNSLYWETTIAMQNGAGASVPGTVTQSTNYEWRFTPATALTPGSHTFKAVQTVSGEASLPSDALTVKVKPPQPAITPPSGPIAAKTPLTVTNLYTTVAPTLKMRRTGTTTEVAGTFTGSGATRTFTPRDNWLIGANSVTVTQTVNTVESDPSQPCTFTFNLSAPVMTRPTGPTHSRPTFEGTGHEGATVNVVQHNYPTPVLATGTVVNGEWQASLLAEIADLPVGPYQVSARQIVGAAQSGWMGAFTINIKPPKPAIMPPIGVIAARTPLTVTNLYTTRTPTLKMLRAGTTTEVAGTFTGSGDTRTFTPSADWSIGNNSVTVTQTVRNVESDPSQPCAFTFTLPRPEMTDPTGPTHSRPTFEGTGHEGATVNVVQHYGPSNLLATGTVVNGRWQAPFLAGREELPAGRYQVSAKQIVGAAQSGWMNAFALQIKPPQPAIMPPIGVIAARTPLTVTNLYTTRTPTLKMLRAGTTTEVAGTFTGSGATRTFTPSADWSIGAHSVTVTQTVDTVESDPSAVCTFTLIPTQLAILPPSEPVVQRSPLTVTQVDRRATHLKMSWAGTTDEVAGDFSGTGTTREFIPHTDWKWGSNSVTVVQTVEGVVSNPSAPCTFTLRPAQLIIDEPHEGSRHPVDVKISGSCLAGARVFVYSQAGTSLGEAVVSHTSWVFTYASPWPVGVKHVKAVQRVNGQDSLPSDVRMFKVIPEPPAITAPTPPLASRTPLVVTQVHSSVVNAGGLKMVHASTDIEVVGTFTGSGGTRTFTPGEDWSIGSNSVTVKQTVNTVESDPSVVCVFTLMPGQLIIDEPSEGSRHPVDVKISGSCLAGAKVSVSSRDNAYLGEATVTGASWEFLYPWAAGVKHVKAVQQVNGQDSLPSDVRMFKVIPEPPAITAPTPPLTSRTPLVVTQVHSSVVNASGLKMVHAGTDNEVGGAFTGSGGTRTFTPDEDWSIGSNSVTVTQTLNTVESDPSPPCAFTLILPPPVITGPSEPTNSRPTFAGTGYEDATVEVAEHTRLDTVLATATVHNGIWQATLHAQSPDLPAGRIYLSARQSVGEEWSEWLAPAFEIQIKPHQPVITPPREPLTPFGALTITQVHAEMSELKMLTDWGMDVGGTFSPVGTDWVFEPAMPWIIGDNAVKVVQVVDTVESDPSAVCTYKGRPPKPVITPPNGPLDPQGTLEITQVYIAPAD